jgi:GNAT superfamily N-acetyltransferase
MEMSVDTHETQRTSIRRATAEDGIALLALIDALADYEHLDRPDAGARGRLLSDAFGPVPRIEAWLAEFDGVPAGYAIIFETYSSFLALPTLYLEDIFVLPEYRNRKIGLSLFLAVGDLARQRGCGRMEWTVLHWNSLAIDFYRRLGARHMDEWQLFRLTAEQLNELPSVDTANGIR